MEGKHDFGIWYRMMTHTYVEGYDYPNQDEVDSEGLTRSDLR